MIDIATETSEVSATRSRDPYVLPVAILAAVLILIANLSGIATGDDGVGYRAIADSLIDGRGYGYFLENPVTIWPPLWPGLMAAVAKITPLDTIGAAILLNAATIFLAVLVGNRLLRTLVRDDRLVMAGTFVIGAGGLSIGFGHLLMTDFAFAVVLMAWMLTLIRFRRTQTLTWLVASGLWVWVGFGLRYVAIVMVATGGLWLLLDGRERFVVRLRNGVVYGVVAVVLPLVWMLRNRSVDGTLTGERYPSARDLVHNAFDTLATLGKMVLPGVLNGADTLWAGVGALVLVLGAVVGWKALTALPKRDAHDTPVHRFVVMLGGGVGLVLLHVAVYALYMLYVRTTTALNQLDLRLLNPLYFGLIVLALVMVDRLSWVDGDPANRWFRGGRIAAFAWAAANVAAGLVAVVGFAAGNSFFSGNYEDDLFVKVRENPALEALPSDCRVYSNLPNALYPAVDSQWSPRRTGLESNELVDDLDKLVPTLDSQPACLVWIDEDPHYGHLWSRTQLENRLTLDTLATNGDVTVYRMEPKAG